MFNKITDNRKRVELTEAFKAKMTEFKKETLFPEKPLGEFEFNENFKLCVDLCFRHVAPHHLNMTWPEYKKLLEIADNKYNLLDMGTILWVFQQRTQHELGIDFEDYSNFQTNGLALMVEWQRIVMVEEKRLEAFLEDNYISEQESEQLQNTGNYKGDKTIPLGAPAEA